MVEKDWSRLYTLFTQVQDSSNVKWPLKNMSAKGKCVYPNLRCPPKNKTSAKKKYFTINFIHLIHKACHILSNFTNQCLCLHFHSQCLHFPHTQLLTSPSPSLSFHNIPSSVPSTALAPSQSLLVRCAAKLLWSTLTKWYIYEDWSFNSGTDFFVSERIRLNG